MGYHNGDGTPHMRHLKHLANLGDPAARSELARWRYRRGEIDFDGMWDEMVDIGSIAWFIEQSKALTLAVCRDWKVLVAAGVEPSRVHILTQPLLSGFIDVSSLCRNMRWGNTSPHDFSEIKPQELNDRGLVLCKSCRRVLLSKKGRRWFGYPRMEIIYTDVGRMLRIDSTEFRVIPDTPDNNWLEHRVGTVWDSYQLFNEDYRNWIGDQSSKMTPCFSPGGLFSLRLFGIRGE